MRMAGFKAVNVKPSSYSGSGQVVQDITKRVYEGILKTGVSTGVYNQRNKRIGSYLFSRSLRL